jgi:hypothetical protein
MEIQFFVNQSEPNKLNKQLLQGDTFNGTLRNECEIEEPTILIESDSTLTSYNYFYIPDFNRFYFRTSITFVRKNLWRVTGKSDPLMSFKEAILEFKVILKDSENAGANNYLSGNQWKSLVKTKTDIINFPNGLSENGEFILITAGG